MPANDRDGRPLKFRKAEHENVQVVPEGERPCPICAQPMATQTELGVSIDVCEEHGIWLDRGELVSIQCRIQAKQRRRSRLAEKEARRQGKIGGIFLGWVSLLFD